MGKIPEGKGIEMMRAALFIDGIFTTFASCVTPNK